VDVFKTAAAMELSGRVELRQSLLTRLVDAPFEERIDLERKIEHLDESTRILGLALKSTDYQTESGTDSGKEIEGHWIDSFNDLARRRNEEWRENLLARALSHESSSPGTVSPRALWAIGNLEKEAFEAFSELLNVCVWPLGNSKAFIPNKPRDPYVRTTARGKKIGVICFILGDSGFLADGSAQTVFVPGSERIFRHGDLGAQIKAKKEIQNGGILLSPLGASIASFCKREWTDEGNKILTEWVESFDEAEADAKLIRLENFPDQF
jgi:hypothetical protein